MSRTMHLIPILFLLISFQPSLAVMIYNDRSIFEANAGSSLITEDFEDFTVNSSGFGAFSNGELFSEGSFSIDNLALTNDITLQRSGLLGTFEVSNSSRYGNWVGPGSIGDLGSPADNDDFQISFSAPVLAFGILIIDSRPESGESISILDENGNVIASVGHPGSSSGTGSDGFIGFILDPGDSLISSVRILEGGSLDDDIGFDNISFLPVPVAVPIPSTVSLILLVGFCYSLSRRITNSR